MVHFLALVVLHVAGTFSSRTLYDEKSCRRTSYCRAGGNAQWQLCCPHEAHDPLAMGKLLVDIRCFRPRSNSVGNCVRDRAAVWQCVYGSIDLGPAKVVLFGILWGVGATLFGLGISRVGLALGFALILGITLRLIRSCRWQYSTQIN